MPAPLLLTLPGWTNSGPTHWQSLWERAHPTRFRRVEQEDWEDPGPDDWLATLDGAIEQAAQPVVLVAHSLSCLTAARWAELHAHDPSIAKVKGALLVAPADVERLGAPEPIRAFAPVPRTRLPFPTIVVVSADDPYTRLDRARDFAKWWGARLEVLEHAGHINAASGFGPFPDGERWLAELVEGVGGTPPGH